MRRGKRLPLDQLQPCLLDMCGAGFPACRQAGEPAPHNLAAVFGNDHPVEVEVGFGKGLFLLNSSQQHPEINYLGIEIDRRYQLFTATRLAKRDIKNVRLACADARVFFRDLLEAESVQAIHVYFPDPWWKKRHQKRRLFTPGFVAECVRVLRPGGYLHLATDVAEYFEEAQRIVSAVKELAVAPPAQAEHDLDYLTNFERKFRLRNLPIYRIMCRREA